MPRGQGLEYAGRSYFVFVAGRGSADKGRGQGGVEGEAVGATAPAVCHELGWSMTAEERVRRDGEEKRMATATVVDRRLKPPKLKRRGG